MARAHGGDRSGDIDGLERALARLVRRANTPRVHDRLALRAGVPLDHALYVTLVRIGDRAPIRLTDLAQDLGVDVSTSSRQVRALEDKGLVDRCGDDRDRRVAQLSLSAAGRSLLAAARTARLEALAAVLARWPDRDIALLGELVERLLDDLDETVGP